MPELILVTEKEYAKAQAVFAEGCGGGLEFRPAPTAEAELAEAVRQGGARVVIVGVEKYTGALYEALAANGPAGGALIVRFGIGHDGIDKPLAQRLGLSLVNTPVDLATSVAELTVFMLGALARHVGLLDARVRGGSFAPQRGNELAGKTAVIVGAGKIGLKVARILSRGFGCRVLASDCLSQAELLARLGLSAEGLRAEYGIEAYSPELDALLPEADLLCLHVPLCAATRGLIGRERLARLKPTCLLANTARGGVVDEAALYDALAGGRLGGAALDVYETEPYAPVDPARDLRNLNSVVLTPHVASDTFEANERMGRECVAQARAFAAGDKARLNLIVDGSLAAID